MIVFSLVVPILLFIFNILKSRNTIIYRITIIYLYILAGLNIYTPDYKSYEILYTYCDSAWARKAYEFGFVQLCIFFKGIGASYQEFRMIFALIYVIIINFTILRLSNRPNFTLAMYLLWPFIPFVSGIRFAMASAIVCFSIPFLIKNTKSGIIQYIIGISIAALFHISTLFYLLFIFFRKRINKYQYAAAFLFIIIISCILGSNSLGSYIFRIFDDGFWAHKLGKWLSMSSREYEHRFNILGLLANSFFIVIFYILINFMGRYIINSIPYDKEHINMDKNDETYFRRITLYKNTSFCLLFTIPAYIVSTEYQRLLYGILLIYYSLWGEFIYRKIKIENDNRLSYCFITFITIILMISFYIYSTPSHDVFATLYDNMLFR